MRVEFADKKLKALEHDTSSDHLYPQGIPRSYRKRLRIIRSASNTRDLYALKSNRTEKLKGDRSDQISMRLNDQYRLILKFIDDEHETKSLIVSIEDYH